MNTETPVFRPDTAASTPASAPSARAPLPETDRRWQGGLTAAYASVTGSSHSRNEDCCIHVPSANRPDFCGVADGVGGGAHGEIASSVLLSHCAKAPKETWAQPSRLVEWLSRADAEVREAIARRTDQAGAATLAAAWFPSQSTAYVLNVGDCRVYQLKPGRMMYSIQQLTVDQTYASLSQQPPPNGKPDDPARMVGAGAVGTPPVIKAQIRKRDLLLFCSDGVHKYVPDEQITQIVSSGLARRQSLEGICDALVRTAQTNGSQDDASALLVMRQPWLFSRWIYGCAVVALLLVSLLAGAQIAFAETRSIIDPTEAPAPPPAPKAKQAPQPEGANAKPERQRPEALERARADDDQRKRARAAARAAERARQDAATRETAAREAKVAAAREATARAAERARQEAAAQEAAKQAIRKAAAARQAAVRAAAAKATNERIATEREAIARELALREAAARELAAHQQAREAAARQATARENAAREAALREAALREAAAREAAVKEAAARDAAREAENREAAARDSARRAAARQAATDLAANKLLASRDGRPRPSLRVGVVFRDCAECPELVWLPQGESMMGEATGQRPVATIDYPLAVGRFEVTFAEWDACVAVGACRRNPRDSGWGRGRQPVIDVAWHEAREYAAWLSRKTGKSYRLLTEAEWEYGARAGTDARYWWGNDTRPGAANCNDCGSRWDGRRPAPVGSFTPNPFGLFDMHGNVWEWVEDCSYDCTSREGPIVRGGAWQGTAHSIRSAARSSVNGNYRDQRIGFRVARID